MKFLNPEFIFLMLPPLFFLAYFILRGGTSYERFFSKNVLDKILIKGDKLGTKGRNILFLSAFALFIFALARPISHQSEVEVQNSSKNLVIAIDISRSMLVDDIYPTRLDFVKNRLKWFIHELPNTNIGLIAFAKDAFLVSPVTSDKKSLEFLLDGLSPDIVSRQGTNLENALHQINIMFPKGGVKDLFLISDGGESDDIKKAIKKAKKDSLHVSVMVVGTKKGGTIKTENGLLKDKNGNIVISKRNDSLLSLSEETNGVYIKEFGGGGGVNLLKKSLTSQKTKHDKKTIKTQKEWFMLPLILGFLLILIALHGLPKRAVFAMLVPLLFVTPSYAGIFDFVSINKANEALKNKEYQKAINEYNKLEQTPQVTYNKANAYYKMKNYDKAQKEYEKVKTDDKNLKSNALFNSGNSYAQQKKYKEALKSYENALKLTPNDEDIKKNIQYVKKKMQKKKKQQNQDKKQNKQKNQDQNQKQNKKDDKNQKNRDGKNQKKDKKQEREKKEKQNTNDKNQTKQNETKQAKAQKKKMQKPKDLEGEKWEKILKSIHPKTQPVKLGEGKNEGEDDEISW